MARARARATGTSGTTGGALPHPSRIVGIAWWRVFGVIAGVAAVIAVVIFVVSTTMKIGLGTDKVADAQTTANEAKALSEKIPREMDEKLAGLKKKLEELPKITPPTEEKKGEGEDPEDLSDILNQLVELDGRIQKLEEEKDKPTVKEEIPNTDDPSSPPKKESPTVIEPGEIDDLLESLQGKDDRVAKIAALRLALMPEAVPGLIDLFGKTEGIMKKKVLWAIGWSGESARRFVLEVVGNPKPHSPERVVACEEVADLLFGPIPKIVIMPTTEVEQQSSRSSSSSTSKPKESEDLSAVIDGKISALETKLGGRIDEMAKDLKNISQALQKPAERSPPSVTSYGGRRFCN